MCQRRRATHACESPHCSLLFCQTPACQDAKRHALVCGAPPEKRPRDSDGDGDGGGEPIAKRAPVPYDRGGPGATRTSVLESIVATTDDLAVAIVAFVVLWRRCVHTDIRRLITTQACADAGLSGVAWLVAQDYARIPPTELPLEPRADAKLASVRAVLASMQQFTQMVISMLGPALKLAIYVPNAGFGNIPVDERARPAFQIEYARLAPTWALLVLPEQQTNALVPPGIPVKPPLFLVRALLAPREPSEYHIIGATNLMYGVGPDTLVRGDEGYIFHGSAGDKPGIHAPSVLFAYYTSALASPPDGDDDIDYNPGRLLERGQNRFAYFMAYYCAKAARQALVIEGHMRGGAGQSGVRELVPFSTMLGALVAP